jgi:hypothetical protein
MIYKIIFSIAIFILNFMIIKEEISNYSRKVKILLLIFSMLWFLTFFMEMSGTIFLIMVTMLIFKFSSKIYTNSIDEMDFYWENIYFVVSLLLSFKVYPFTFLNLRITLLLVFEFIIFYSTFFVSMSLVREKMKTQIAMSEKDDNL